MDSVDLVKKKQDISKAREYIENALTKTLKKQIGLDYWGDLSERLKRMFSAENERLPTYFPQLDEYLNGGLPPYTLSVIVAAMHAGKSNLMVNMAVRQMMKGHNVVYLSLEMAEDELAKRVDAQLTKLDINRIYDSKKKEFLTNLKSVKTGGEGRLLFKQFPTGTASVNDFRSYLYELQMRDIRIDCIYVDYLNIMRPTASSGDGNLYTDVKKIGEELRAMSYIFKCPIVTATQTTRQGVISEIGEISFAMLSESIGTAATADFIMVLGSDSDSLVYQNEIFYKILKNRLGGRVGEIDKMYVDNRSLKMYDSVELDQWISDATISGANTQMAN
jgi:replicative DNA helicase